MESYKCPICGNTNPNSIGYLHGKPYCRACIIFRGNEAIEPKPHLMSSKIFLNYILSPEQQELADKLVNNYISGKSSLVHAVCGSGKTEIVLSIISYVLSNKGTVGFAIPRRDVVIEIADRIKSIFKNNKVIAVYGGHNDKLTGDIICLTTHQLYRYNNYFDLLILDEIDAFPYDENDVLNALFFRSIRGHFIQMSATPSDKVIKFFKQEGYDILELNTRYHRHPLPVPEIITNRMFLRYIKLVKILKEFQAKDKQVFIFCPTIEECEQVYFIIKFFIKQVNYVHSKKEDREKVINDFKKGRIKMLVTTAVLERGVTVKDLQVVIFGADHKLYDKAALIQISGRVGRKKDAPEGRVIYIAKQITKDMEDSIRDIKSANKDLQNLLQGNKTKKINQSINK